MTDTGLDPATATLDRLRELMDNDIMISGPFDRDEESRAYWALSMTSAVINAALEWDTWVRHQGERASFNVLSPLDDVMETALRAPYGSYREHVENRTCEMAQQITGLLHGLNDRTTPDARAWVELLRRLQLLVDDLKDLDADDDLNTSRIADATAILATTAAQMSVAHDLVEGRL